MDKIFIVALIAATIGWIFTAWHLNAQITDLENLNKDLEIKLEAKRAEKANFEAALSLQNAKLKEYEIDVKKAKETLLNKTEEISKKYENIKTEASGCEAKLAQIQKIAEAFHAKSR